MNLPLVIANWKMNIPSNGIPGWMQKEMYEEFHDDPRDRFFQYMGIAPPISHLSELENLFKFGFLGAQDISRFN